MTIFFQLKSSMESSWATQSSKIFSHLSVDPELGLSNDEARLRLQQHGPNLIKVIIKKSRWPIFLKQLKNSVVYVLTIASVVAFAFHLGMQHFDLFLEIFKIKALSVHMSLILLAFALIPVTLVEIYKIWRRK